MGLLAHPSAFVSSVAGSDAPAPLRGHVTSVVESGVQEQVTGTNAGAGVAAVKNVEPVWNWPIGVYPGSSMGANASPVVAEAPVPALVEIPCPGPAGAEFGMMGWSRPIGIDVGPESLSSRRAGASDSTAAMSAESLFAVQTVVKGKESGPAPQASMVRNGRLSMHLDLLHRGALGAGCATSRAPLVYSRGLS
jgi:hypothetical protein